MFPAFFIPPSDRSDSQPTQPSIVYRILIYYYINEPAPIFHNANRNPAFPYPIKFILVIHPCAI